MTAELEAAMNENDRSRDEFLRHMAEHGCAEFSEAGS
jgi:hypothetical protein